MVKQLTPEQKAILSGIRVLEVNGEITWYFHQKIISFFQVLALLKQYNLSIHYLEIKLNQLKKTGSLITKLTISYHQIRTNPQVIFFWKVVIILCKGLVWLFCRVSLIVLISVVFLGLICHEELYYLFNQFCQKLRECFVSSKFFENCLELFKTKSKPKIYQVALFLTETKVSIPVHTALIYIAKKSPLGAAIIVTG